MASVDVSVHGFDRDEERLVAGVAAHLRSHLEALAALADDTVLADGAEETVLVGYELDRDTTVRLGPLADLLADVAPDATASLTTLQAEVHAYAGAPATEVRFVVTGLAVDDLVQTVVRRDPAGRWDALVARVTVADCVVVEGDTVAGVLVVAPGTPVAARLRWIDADAQLRGRVAAWHGASDPLRGAVYRAQHAAGLNDLPPYASIADARAELAEIVTSERFTRQWPDAVVPELQGDAPAGTRAVTVFDDDVPVELRVALEHCSLPTVLHELAHVLTPHAVCSHDETFVAAFVELLELFSATGDARRFLACLAAEGVALTAAA